ncbi:MAG: hypothetical protein M3R38_12610 [Actinomycetota bacterium]|nr:hypothetical protein [Actinomycetota bacterium]
MDHIYGGTGDDHINSIFDDSKDYVDCGPGTDSINGQLSTEPTPKDVYVNCERVAG